MSNWRRESLSPGIYDEPISERVEQQLSELSERFEVHRRHATGAELAGLPLESLLADAVALALRSVGSDREATFNLAHEVLSLLQSHAPKAFPRPEELRLRDDHLVAIAERPAAAPQRPRGSLHASSLIVNAEGERLLDHVRSEFDSADRVDLLCAFVKLSGFEKFRAEFERHCISRGRPLRVLTTTYMAATDAVAIERLAALPNVEVKVSYDEHATRLHAKAWVFHRQNGYSTAYVGSSNLSHSAQTDGLEWNVRVTQQGQPALVAQMVETFEQYWAAPHQFEVYRTGHEPDRRRLVRALSTGDPRSDGTTLQFDIEPKDFQKPNLDELAAARALGRHRNLLVAATGTGKTVMAALDYQRLRQAGTVDTLLFVAHRREILEQSRAMFRAVLKVSGFGELLCEGERLAPRVELGYHSRLLLSGKGGGAMANAKVTVSSRITDKSCLKKATECSAAWEARLKRDGSTGRFEVAHGNFHSCDEAHDMSHNKGLWIHTVDAECRVFVTRAGNHQWFSGSTRHKEAVSYIRGACTCGNGH